MKSFDLSTVEPFEIASRRPPTENDSLCFRVTRNCYWNKCKFCLLNMTGAGFSRRSLEEVKADISKAKVIDDLLRDYGLGVPYYSHNDYQRVMPLIEDIRRAKEVSKAAEVDSEDTVSQGADQGSEKTTTPDANQRSENTVSSDADARKEWFNSWFKDKPLLEDSIYHLLSWRIGGGKTCFIGDADSLILQPDFLHEVMDHIKSNFPSLNRFTIYGRTGTAAKIRSLDELKEFSRAGINRVHFGLESGSDRVLSLVSKGVTAAQHIEGCLKVKEAGLSCSIYIMPGLGGSELSQENAVETARVVNEIEPDFVRIRTLSIFPSTPLEAMKLAGTFQEASEEEVVLELKTLIENIHCRTELLSDSAANLLGIFGTLPQDREVMLRNINAYLSLSPREKLEFSLSARIRSFMSQYGSLSEDIYDNLRQYISNNALDCSKMSDQNITTSINLVRSKLMP